MDINKELILTGTTRKKLLSMFNELKKNLTKNDAMKYYLVYSEMSLMEILQNFDIIYKEPHKGVKFITELITTYDIPPVYYRLISDEIRNYLAEKGKDMSAGQYGLYDKLMNTLFTLESETDRVYSMMLLMHDDLESVDNNPVTVLYNEKYNYMKSNDENVRNDAIVNMRDIILSSDVDLLPDIMVTCFDVEELVTDLSEYMRRLFSDVNNAYGIIRAIKANSILNRLIAMPYIKRKLNKQNLNFKHLIMEYADIRKVIDVVKDITVQEAPETPVYSSLKNGINNLYDMEVMNDIMEEDNINSKIETLTKEKEALSTISDFYLFDMLSATPEELDDAYDEALCDLYTAGTDEPIVESVSAGQEYLYGILQSRISAIDEEIYALEFTKGGKQSETIADRMGDEAERDAVKAKVTVNKPEPQKPKSSAMRKIQTSALDADVKAKSATKGLERAKQEVKNTATAIGKIPKNIADSTKKQINEWDTMDDERRKKFILEAGFRKKYFRLFRLALTHYVAFAVNPLLNIVVFICQHFSNEKNLRIKNELAAELEAEIKICEEKINDANNKGDNEKKYKMMRIKDKLTAELTRVKTNTRYI